MTDTTTAVQVVARVTTPTPQIATSTRRSFWAKAFDPWQRKEINRAIRGVREGDDDAVEKFVSLYASLRMKPKRQATVLDKLAWEFKSQATTLDKLAWEAKSQTSEVPIDQEAALPADNLVYAFRQLVRSRALEIKDKATDWTVQETGIADAVQRMQDQISAIVRDETEAGTYQEYPELRLSCAKAELALLKDKEAREDRLSRFVRDDQLQGWALEIATRSMYRSVIEHACHIENLVPSVIGNGYSRTVMADMITAATNGEREALLGSISSISDASKPGGSGVMPLLAALVGNPDTVFDVLACASRCKAVSLDDEVTLTSKLLEKGHKGERTLKKALHKPETVVIAIRSLVGSERGRQLVMRAVEEAGKERARTMYYRTSDPAREPVFEMDDLDERSAKKRMAMHLSAKESTMLEILAGLGEEKIVHVLAEWSSKPETRGYFLRLAAMLDVRSVILHNSVYGYTQADEADGPKGMSKYEMKRERRAARRSMIKMMEAEAERRMVPLRDAMQRMLDATSKIVEADPKKDEIYMGAYAEIDGVRAQIKAGFRYGKAPPPEPERRTATEEPILTSAQRQAKIAALRASLDAKQAAKEREADSETAGGFDSTAFIAKEFRAAVAKPAVSEVTEANTRIVALKKAMGALFSSFSQQLRLKQRAVGLETAFGAREGDVELRGIAEVEFTSDSFVDPTIASPTGQSTSTQG